MPIVTTETVRKIADGLRTQNGLLSIIADKSAGSVKLDSFADVQAAVRAGIAPKLFKIGDQIVAPYTYNGVVYDCPWDIVSFEDVTVKDENGNDKTVPGITLMQHFATIESIQFDAPEPDNPDANIKQYGYSNYVLSAQRQWLNSSADKGQWWAAQHQYDVAPAQLGSYTGFVAGWTDDFLAVLGNTKQGVALNTVTDGGRVEYIYDKFFLPSIEQIYSVPQLEGAEGAYWPYWKEVLGYSAPSNAADDKRKIMGLNAQTVAQSCRLRSAVRGSSCYAWSVYGSSGQVNNHAATNAYRCAPACVIC